MNRLIALVAITFLVGLASGTHSAGASHTTFYFPWDSGLEIQYSSGPHKFANPCTKVPLSTTVGIDFSTARRVSDRVAVPNFPVLAMADGRVVAFKSNWKKGDTETRGNYVIVSHGDGWYTEYWHLQSVDASILQGESGAITRGQVLGKAGNTGYASGINLHVQLRYGSTAKSWNGQLVNGWRVRAIRAGTASSSYSLNYLGTLTKGTESTRSATMCGLTSTKWVGSAANASAAANSNWTTAGTYLKSSNRAHR